MLKLERTHDFQVFVSPTDKEITKINPPSFNWPQEKFEDVYTIEIQNASKTYHVEHKDICSPFQLTSKLDMGDYQWRVTDSKNQTSEWLSFSVDNTSENYLPPTAKELFDMAKGRDQFLMYFDEDINIVKEHSQDAYEKFKTTASKVNLDKISYQAHYRRGEEEGKRTAITNVREWIDRDLMAATILYKIWGEKEYGETAIKLLLRLAEWSPEGPASLLRPCTWGDEVGLSLSRNLFLAYHWLSPLLNESEKGFIRPMLIRIGYQLEERLEQDMFKQFPGHSHTSRLPAYLGVAALALHKEFEVSVCERWLNYSLMIYRGVLPFYGGNDGSWAEGCFYSSSYSKWTHPFFLSVERLSDFSFYNHSFYKNYHNFAVDFLANNNDIHPFGDGFWCKREGDEWPGFFAQNPLRIYADRFGDKQAKQISQELENAIDWYKLHLLDVVPTVKQLDASKKSAENANNKDMERTRDYHKYYAFAGYGKAVLDSQELYFRASRFGNSSHRHGDQGNFAFVDSGIGILSPTGSYGYKFGSGHHKEWTRTTQAHNLPLLGGVGQILNNESATAKLLQEKSSSSYYFVQLDLSNAYEKSEKFIRNIILVQDKGLIICDHISLQEQQSIEWRLHSHLESKEDNNKVNLREKDLSYTLNLHSHQDVKPTIVFGYDQDKTHGEKVTSDAREDVYHMEWKLPNTKDHLVIASCEKGTPTNITTSENIVTVNLGNETIVIDTNSSAVTFK